MSSYVTVLLFSLVYVRLKLSNDELMSFAGDGYVSS